VRRVLAGLVAALLVGGVAALSRVRQRETPVDGVVRLSWRTRSERVQHCRQLTPEEIAALPAHMRHTEECEGRVLPYRLRVELDGRVVAARTVQGGGARGDRPIYVLQEIPAAPGPHRLAVDFVREDAERHAAASGPDEDDPDEDAVEAHLSAAPPRLSLRAAVELRAGGVLLVTYDPDRAALVLRGAAPADPR
jgi:hypothetical protein